MTYQVKNTSNGTGINKGVTTTTGFIGDVFGLKILSAQGFGILDANPRDYQVKNISNGTGQPKS